MGLASGCLECPPHIVQMSNSRGDAALLGLHIRGKFERESFREKSIPANMRRHFTLNRRVAAACAVAAATALWIDHCSAQPFIAADYATNATYATGWSAGQNDGYGFTAWDFDGTSSGAPIEQGMTFDYSSPFDVLGTAWTLYNPPGPDTVGCLKPGVASLRCSPIRRSK